MKRNATPIRDATGEFIKIVAAYIIPLLHGAVLDGPRSGIRNVSDLTSFHTANRIVIAVPGADGSCLTLKRSVPFSVEELDFARMVVEKVHADKLHETGAYHIILCDLVERAIARLLDEECAETIHRVIRVYNQWATEAHGGRRVSHTTGIRLDVSRETGSNLFDLKDDAFVKSLSETPDFILSVDRRGDILGVDHLPGRPSNSRRDQEIFAPGPLAETALWTNSRHRIAVRLTAQGEILIFRNKTLAFAKRRSYWRSLPHKALLEAFLRESASACQRDTGMAVYLTILDLAFSGFGGCIGVITRDGKAERDIERASPGLLFDSPDPVQRVRMLQTIIKGRKFFQVPRPLRATLCKLDGALVIDEEGGIVTAGVMVKTNGTPIAGGGRSAAARALAERGVGVKISREGFVEVYDRSDTPILFA